MDPRFRVSAGFGDPTGLFVRCSSCGVGFLMVQLTNHGKLRPESELPMKMTLPLATKLEIEDPLEDEHGPLNKRSKVASLPSLQQGISLRFLLFFLFFN